MDNKSDLSYYHFKKVVDKNQDSKTLCTVFRVALDQATLAG